MFRTFSFPFEHPVSLIFSWSTSGRSLKPLCFSFSLNENTWLSPFCAQKNCRVKCKSICLSKPQCPFYLCFQFFQLTALLSLSNLSDVLSSVLEIHCNSHLLYVVTEFLVFDQDFSYSSCTLSSACSAFRLVSITHVSSLYSSSH